MYKSQTITINNFSGGIADNPRKNSANEFVIAKHFDVFSDPQKLIPYRSLEADTNDGSTATGMKQYYVRDFLYASTSAKLYGLGQEATSKTKIVNKADATTGNWTLPANSEGNGAVWNGSFTEFKNYLWGFQGTNQLWKYGLLSGTPSITNSVSTVASTITSVANGVINSIGDLYVAYNNVVVRIAPDTTTITDSAKTVPTNYKITSMCNYGNYLAIGCAPISPYNGVSKVFLWDYASTEKFQEVIDWGEGELRVLETIEGMLVGVSDVYLNNATGAGKGSMIIRGYAGGTPQVLKEVFTQKLTGKTMPTSKAVKNNRLFFSAKIMTNSTGTTYDEGIWSFGRKNASYPWALNLDIIDENVTTDGIQAFGLAGNYFFIASNNDGSITKTDDTATYSFSSIYETLTFNFGDVGLLKQLKTFRLWTAPLPASSTVTLKYKTNSDTSWTTIGTLSTANKQQRDFINIESSSDAFATFNEVKFRLESTGGAEILGYQITAQPITGTENG